MLYALSIINLRNCIFFPASIFTRLSVKLEINLEEIVSLHGVENPRINLFCVEVKGLMHSLSICLLNCSFGNISTLYLLSHNLESPAKAAVSACVFTVSLHCCAAPEQTEVLDKGISNIFQIYKVKCWF